MDSRMGFLLLVIGLMIIFFILLYWNPLLLLGIILVVIVFAIYWNRWIYDSRYRGNSFAETLIEKAAKQNGLIQFGDPTDIRQRICFFSGYSGLSNEFSEFEVKYRESDDSNYWYMAKYDPNLDGIIILAVSQGVLEWNDFASVKFVNRSEEEIRQRTCSGPDPVCSSIISIKYTPGEKTPLFCPDHTTAWSPK
jgi:hypothetical protein